MFRLNIDPISQDSQGLIVPHTLFPLSHSLKAPPPQPHPFFLHPSLFPTHQLPVSSCPSLPTPSCDSLSLSKITSLELL